MPAKRKRPGRPRNKDKVRVVWLYLRPSERKKIEAKFGKVQTAVREVVLPQCG